MSNRTARLAFALLFVLTSVMPPVAFAAPDRVKPGAPKALKAEEPRDAQPSGATGRILLPVTSIESTASHAETTDSRALLLPVQIVRADVQSSQTANVSSDRLTRPQQPDKTVLTFGTPTTITVQVSPDALIANSGATASITATVVDSDGAFVSGVDLNADLSPSTLGSVVSMTQSNGNGQSFGTWTAGATLGSGVLSVGDGTVTGTAFVTLTTGTPISLSIETSADGLGSPIEAYTMTLYDTLIVYAVRRDQYGNVVPDPANAAWSGTGILAGNLSPASGVSTTTGSGR